MASWEAAALKLQSHIAVTSDPNSLDKDKCLPPLPLQQKSTVTTTIEAEEPTKGWKPLSLSTPILSAVIALTLLLAAAVETIAQRSAAQGGLALSPTLDDLPGYAKFSYLYVPTIIAVLYSIIWSWIDLDVKRMQPWFELSKSDGTTGENSLFLDYQYDFVALVPFKAAKRKHWPVFFGGTAMVIVFWALTPLQSALLGTGVVKQTDSVMIDTRSQLLPMREHDSLLDPEFLNTGYAVGWLDQPFPPFTTSKYAILPFYTANNTLPEKVDSNVTAVTTKLSTELSCWPAEIHQDGPRSKSSYFFLNGQGCNTSVSFGVTSRRRMYYIGYYSSPYSAFYLANSACPKTPNSTHQFLAIWEKTIEAPGEKTPYFNITALFCQPQYYKQQVYTRVNTSDWKPDSEFEQILSPKEVLTEEEFNSTAFEFLLANGMADRPIVKDAPFNSVIEQHPRLNYTGFTQPVSNMVGFALAGKNLSSDTYGDPDVLEQVYHDAHQYLFSLAVNKLLINGTEMSNRTASVDYLLSGVIVSRVFATSVECLLLVVAVFTIVILRSCRKAPSHLPGNPSSINRYIELFRDSTNLMQSFRSMDNATEEALLEEYKNDRFRLYGNKKYTLVDMDRVAKKDIDSEEHKVSTQKGYYDPVRPLVLRRASGALFVAVLIGAMIFLSYLKQQETRLNGLHRPSESFEVLQILENYIPTIFATLIEPLWILLNRLLCVLQPFKDLWEGKAKPSHSLDSTYTSIPPQLVFLRAAKSGHFVLVLVCTMALLANLLAVGLGSLFNEEPMTAAYPETLRPSFAARFDNNSVFTFDNYLTDNLVTTSQYADHKYVALANISSGTKLPAWVSPEYYFQPFELGDAKSGNPADTYRIETQGFGVHTNCTPIEPFKMPIYKTQPQFVMSADGKTCTQESLIDYASFQIRESTLNRSSGVSAVEYGDARTAAFSGSPCDRPLTLGWGRTATAENSNATVNASFVICYPVFETAKFNVTVDASGHVISYNRISDLKASLDYADSRVHTDIVFEVYNRWWNIDGYEWHNDTTIRDWMNYFITVLDGSRDNIDPVAPVPKPETLIPAIEDIYRRLYAIILSLNEQLFDHNDVGKPATVLRFTKETRIFMEDASFIITMTVLALNIVVASIFYIRAVAFVLPRMPTTIGSVLAYIAPSRLVSSGLKGMPGQNDRTLSFGRYVGVDGKVHIGIELDPHVVRIEPTSLRGKSHFFERMWTKLRRGGEQPVRRSVKSGTWL
ncbi:hypothetical protein CDV36_000499 [Fusarium kuroshium]|uniref:Uncharacterized protein n=1 Tax=Fusarium kuroshium TaxID=2010991 RepID=A0A3M2SRT6_9HYPO|nr:hypothetical protein CDV36_000499 [Fusarium kuroshium]